MTRSTNMLTPDGLGFSTDAQTLPLTEASAAGGKVRKPLRGDAHQIDFFGSRVLIKHNRHV